MRHRSIIGHTYSSYDNDLAKNRRKAADRHGDWSCKAVPYLSYSPVRQQEGGFFVHDRSSELAAAILRFRRARARKLPADLFGEPAWELLLELFVADAAGRRLTGRDILMRSNTSAIVLSRWLKHLTAVALIIGDGSGDLDDELTLSGLGMQAIESILEDARAINQSTAA